METPDAHTTTAPPPRRFLLGRILKAVAWALPLVVAVGAAAFFYLQWQKAQEQVQSTPAGESSEASREEIEGVVEELSRIVLLPKDETPTLSTIKDKDSLTENQDFFRDAQNGDQVLVYQQARKAFLYRPGTKKLINLAPINIADADSSQTQPTVAAATDKPSPSLEAESFTTELRNGTSKQGLIYDFEPKLLGAFKQAEVSDRNNAARDDYEESVVVAVNLTKKAIVQQVANELDLAVVNMPAGEAKGEADLLIILGADQL